LNCKACNSIPKNQALNNGIFLPLFNGIFHANIPSGATALHVFPNPAANHASTCNVITPDAYENAELVTTDILHKVVTTASCSTNIITNISLPVPSGMYFISAATKSGKKMAAKIIVE
jgi:hypothetical protein